jgi:hypothetical protein
VRWRSDIVAMFRERWWLVAGWIVVVVGVVTLLATSDWWTPRPDESVVAVRSSAAAKKHLLKELERFDEDHSLYLGYDSNDPADVTEDGPSALEVYDDATETLTAALDEADTKCAARVPFTANVTRGGVLSTDVDLTILGAATSSRLETGLEYIEGTDAPEGTTFVHVVVKARNNGSEATYPATNVALVSSGGKVYSQEYEITSDTLTSAQPDEEIVGVVLFRVPKEVVANEQLYAILNDVVFRTSDAAHAINRHDCVRLAPRLAAHVGDEDGIVDARLVE